MTPEEKRQFEEWQLKTENRINFLIEHQADFDARLEEMRSQAELDRQIMRAAIGEMHDAVGEMRGAVNQMITIAEALQGNIVALSKVQVGTSQRVGRLEERIDRIEHREE